MIFNHKTLIFYTVVTLCLLTILLTTPFLRYPYDMFHHLIVIDNLYESLSHPVNKMIGIWANDIYIMLPSGGHEAVVLPRPRYLWHYLWAYLFYMLDIDSTQMFLRAKIIHVVQTYISLFAIYYFSKVMIRNILKKIDALALQWLSFWSVIIWISIFATFSAAYHQVWIMWYSVNYQITLPLFWYILSLTLVLIFEDTSWKIKLFFVLQILLFSRFMLQVHSMEFMYYLMYLAVLSLVFLDRVYSVIKKYFYAVIPIVLAIVYMAKHYQPEKSLIFSYLSVEKLPALYEKIMHEGAVLLSGYNRASASINELMYFIFYFTLMGLLFLLWNKWKKRNLNIDMRILFFMLLTSLFVLIPIYQFSGGLFSIITYTMVVNRLYYSASLFVLIPIFTYILLGNYRLRYTNMFIGCALILVGIFSKHSDLVHHNYYKNIQSIKNSFDERKVGFNLTQGQIDTIGKLIETYEKNSVTGKKIKYYARADIAFVIKYIYKKNVYWEGRRANPDYRKIYQQHKDNPDFENILFITPKDFPDYQPYT